MARQMNRLTEMLRKARRVVLRRGAPADEADDIVQEAFARLEAYTRAHEVRSEEAFLLTAAVHIVQDRKRRRSRSPFEAGSVDVATIADRGPLPDDILRARERLRRAEAGLDQLSPDARRILLAHRLDGLTFAKIAEREGLSVAAVEKRVARAIHFLTRWMDGW